MNSRRDDFVPTSLALHRGMGELTYNHIMDDIPPNKRGRKATTGGTAQAQVRKLYNKTRVDQLSPQLVQRVHEEQMYERWWGGDVRDVWAVRYD